MSHWFVHVVAIKQQMIQATLETIYMTGVTSLIAGFLGLATGLLLVVTQNGGISQDRIFYVVLDKIVNLLRSVYLSFSFTYLLIRHIKAKLSLNRQSYR